MPHHLQIYDTTALTLLKACIIHCLTYKDWASCAFPSGMCTPLPKILDPPLQTPASLLLKTRRLRWFGHVSWMGQERLPKALLSQRRSGNAKQRRGRCRNRWIDAVARDAKLAGMDQDLESTAADKAQWRDMLVLLVS